MASDPPANYMILQQYYSVISMPNGQAFDASQLMSTHKEKMTGFWHTSTTNISYTIEEYNVKQYEGGKEVAYAIRYNY